MMGLSFGIGAINARVETSTMGQTTGRERGSQDRVIKSDSPWKILGVSSGRGYWVNSQVKAPQGQPGKTRVATK